MKYLSLLFFYLACFNTFSQQQDGKMILPGLSVENIKKSITGFDEIIFYNTYGFWNENHLIKGIGCKGNSCYSVIFKYKNEQGDVQLCKRIKKKKIKNFSMEEYRNSIISIDSDSLNVQIEPTTKTGLKVSGGDTYAVFYYNILDGNIVLKKAYMPRFYQERIFIDDREEFLKLFDNLTKW